VAVEDAGGAELGVGGAGGDVEGELEQLGAEVGGLGRAGLGAAVELG
jgi:hypothetical protein